MSVINIKDKDAEGKPLKYDNYVARGYGHLKRSRYCNPFSKFLYKGGLHLSKFDDYFWSSPELYNTVHELKGQTLACWCKPELCHADLLCYLANLPDEERQRVIAENARPKRKAADDTHTEEPALKKQKLTCPWSFNICKKDTSNDSDLIFE